MVSGSGVGHGTPDFDALSERSNYRRESQSTVAGPPSCASVALRRRLCHIQQIYHFFVQFFQLSLLTRLKKLIEVCTDNRKTKCIPPPEIKCHLTCFELATLEEVRTS